MATEKTQRLRQLDFLRGVAIILVLFRHQKVFVFTTNMGWIGVDLFFVLSGFLVSGLLFQEYQKFGKVNPKRFLIRRGFKIYPIYFLVYPLYVFTKDTVTPIGIVGDLTFTQNYVTGWGSALPASWSLAVEEHFYIGLSLLLWWGIKTNRIRLLTMSPDKKKIPNLPQTIIGIMILCLLFRFASNYFLPAQQIRNITMTHLRLDSLLCGVLIAYFFYFQYTTLAARFRSNRYALYAVMILGVAWTPFVIMVPSFFAKTIGFSLLCISFGILLLYFLLTEDINTKLNKVLSKPVVSIVSKIGYCSYSIYIIHTFVNWAFLVIATRYGFYNIYAAFIITSIVTVLVGMFMTYKVEQYFLDLRNRFYPSTAVYKIPAANEGKDTIG